MPRYSHAYEVHGIPDCHLFKNNIRTILNMHASLKIKVIKANTTPNMGKVLRKGIMSRSAMVKNSYKNQLLKPNQRCV